MNNLAETTTLEKPPSSGGQCAAPGCAIRPILFSGPMVRAILAGKKVQTRRVVKDVSADCELMLPAGDAWWQQCYRDGSGAIHSKSWLTKCPYGMIGDLLWVRETWCMAGPDGTYDAAPADGRPCWPDALPMEQRAFYRATEPGIDVEDGGGWVPSIHMPRWASRITLEITNIRAEKLQKISDLEARMEGVDPTTSGGVMGCKRGFMDLWDSINSKRPGCSWSDNPWVWVVEFRKV